MLEKFLKNYKNIRNILRNKVIYPKHKTLKIFENLVEFPKILRVSDNFLTSSNPGLKT